MKPFGHCVLSLPLGILLLSTGLAASAQLTPLSDEASLSDPSSLTQKHPVVATAAPGSFHLAWEEDDLLATGGISWRRIQLDGFSLGEVLRQESGSGTAFRQPALASDDQGNALLAWRDEAGAGGACLRGALLEAAGTVLTTLQPIPDVAGICPARFEAALAPGRRGSLVWDPFQGTSTGTDIFYQAYDSDGSFADEVLNLSDDGSVFSNQGDQFGPAMDSNNTGQGMAVWINEGPNAPCSLCAHRLTPGGERWGTILPIDPQGTARRPQVAVGPAPAQYFVVWERQRVGGVDSDIVGQLLNPSGEPATGPVLISASAGHHTLPAVAADQSGNLIVTWLRGQSNLLGAPLTQPAVMARLLNRFALPRGPEIQVNEGTVAEDLVAKDGPTVALQGDGTALVAWRSVKVPERGEIAGRLLQANLATDCPDDPHVLCLMDDRFQVQVEWQNFQGDRGQGTVVSAVSNKSGLFWFFKDDNWELMVKMLDGCSIGNHYWIFSAATTNVEYTLTVTDTLSGQTAQYFNPLGRASPAITDTKALQVCP